MTQDEMVGWHLRLYGQQSEQTQEDSEGQGSLVNCHPWDCKELDLVTGWHHRLNGHEFEQTLEDSEGQGSLVCCSP